MKLSEVKTFIYIDASNIRSACLNSCGFHIDFVKLCNYFNNKYSNLEKIYYYEGLSKTDEAKLNYLNELSKCKKCETRVLERKGYVEPPKYREYICKTCENRNRVKVAPKILKLKSNVDVYLATDMMVDSTKNQGELHIVIVSCDGDYTEAILNILKVNPDVRITVMATPKTAIKNCLSSRLKMLCRIIDQAHYNLIDITSIKDLIIKEDAQENELKIEQPT